MLLCTVASVELGEFMVGNHRLFFFFFFITALIKRCRKISFTIILSVC